ncbi:hypothetical protein ABVT39_004424 [Epinephelus coioides]
MKHDYYLTVMFMLFDQKQPDKKWSTARGGHAETHLLADEEVISAMKTSARAHVTLRGLFECTSAEPNHIVFIFLFSMAGQKSGRGGSMFSVRGLDTPQL